MSSPRPLHAVPQKVNRPTRAGRCDVASQVLATGQQDTAVRVLTPVSGPSRGQIAVQVGRILVYATDRDALNSYAMAWAQAATLADQAFGPEPLPPGSAA